MGRAQGGENAGGLSVQSSGVLKCEVQAVRQSDGWGGLRDCNSRGGVWEEGPRVVVLLWSVERR